MSGTVIIHQLPVSLSNASLKTETDVFLSKHFTNILNEIIFYHNIPGLMVKMSILLLIPDSSYDYLYIRELAQIRIHGDQSVINQLLVIIGPKNITVLEDW